MVFWVIVFLWLAVLGTVVACFIRNPRIFGTTRLLLAVVAIDAIQNIVENVCFGAYFGGQYGIFPAAVTDLLGAPALLIVPKIINVAAGCVVLGLLLLRWLPSAVREREDSDNHIDAARISASKVDEFVGHVSHELRTPLTSIAGSLGLLDSGAYGPLPPNVARLVSIAYNSAQRLVRLINDLLDIGKIEAGKMTLDFEPIDLRAAAETAIDANRAFADVHGVSIRLEMAQANCIVRADADRLSQVFTNLLSNAIKFSPRGSEVLVTIEQIAYGGRVIVRDHGCGIPAEFKSRIFEKFAQAETSVLRKSGSGLGLNIVAKIIAQHGGTVGFEDAADGGAAFYFEIPLWNFDSGEIEVLAEVPIRRAV